MKKLGKNFLLLVGLCFLASSKSPIGIFACFAWGCFVLSSLLRTTSQKRTAKESRYLQILLFAGFAVRLCHTLLYPPLLWADARIYWNFIVDPLQSILGSPDRPPGYVFFAKVVRLFQIDPDPVSLCIVQGWINTYGIYQIYRIGQILFGKKTALMSATFFALFLPFIDVSSSKILTETLALFLFQSFLILFSTWFKNSSTVSSPSQFLLASQAGFFLSLSLTVRPSSILLLPLTWTAAIFQKGRWKHKAAFLAMVTLVSQIFPLGIALKNGLLFGVFKSSLNSTEFLLTALTTPYQSVPRFLTLNRENAENLKIPRWDTGPIFLEHLSPGKWIESIPLDRQRDRLIHTLKARHLLPQDFHHDANEAIRELVLPPEWEKRVQARMQLTQKIFAGVGKPYDPEKNRRLISWIIKWHLMNGVYQDLLKKSVIEEEFLSYQEVLRGILLRAWDYLKFPPDTRQLYADSSEWFMYPATALITNFQHLIFGFLALSTCLFLFNRSLDEVRSVLFCWIGFAAFLGFFSTISVPEFRYLLPAWPYAILLAARGFQQIVSYAGSVLNETNTKALS